MAFYSKQELLNLGFFSVGENPMISSRASFYGCSRIVIGDHVRIDDFCILSAGEGGIELGSYIHLAVYSSIIGAGKVHIHDFCNISSRVSIYSSNDDYSGEFMTNPMVCELYTNVTHGPVILNKHVIVGAGSVILPNVTIGLGGAIGALSLVNSSLNPLGIYAGQPVKYIKARKENFLELEAQFIKSKYNQGIN